MPEHPISILPDAQEELLPETPCHTDNGYKPEGIPETGCAPKHKLLIVEDNPDLLMYLKILFKPDYLIFTAENGEEGVKAARREMPDLVLTDVMMPVMDGYECCHILKEDVDTCGIPVILLTALTDDDSMMKGIKLGADDYILKPFNPEVLRAKVERLIQNRTELKQTYAKLLLSTDTDDNRPEEENEETGGEENKDTTVTEDPFIARILELVNQNLLNPDFNVKKLADMLNMSQPTLYRKVKQTTGFTIIELVRSVRLKQSAELLKTRKYSVQEVAERVGYNDIPTFRKHFVDFYGVTPSAFTGKEDGGG